MNQLWKISDCLKSVKRKHNYAVYHSLYGQLVLMNQPAFVLLNQLKKSGMLKSAVLSKMEDKKPELKNFFGELKKRYFLAPSNLDEYIFLDESAKARKRKAKTGYLIRGLQLIVSNACNFRCKYCFVNDMYNSKERTEFQTNSANQAMAWDIAKMAMDKMLKLLKENKHQTLTVEFFGGEPLTNWPLVKKILKYYHNKKYGVNIAYTITTNGSLITKEIAETFKKYNVAAVISFDSPKNKERVCADGRGALETIGGNLEILKKTGNWAAFNSTLSKETLPDYDGRALVDFAKQNGIAMIGLILDLDLKFYQNKNNKEQVVKKLWTTYQYAKQNGIAIAGYWHQIFNQIIGRQALNLRSGYKTCPAAGCKISVEPAGHIFICKCCSGYLGHIKNPEQVLASEKYLEYAMKAYRNAADCAGCEIENFCAGVCMGSLERKYDSMDIIEKSSCEVFKNITKKLIMELKDNEAQKLYL